MKVIATLAAVTLLGAAAPAFAQYDRAPPPGAATGMAILPPYEMLTIVRSMGFDPIARPVLRGPVYVIRALDEDDIPVRVAIDARSGNVVRVTEGGPGGGQGGRFGEYGLPPESVPPGAVYPAPRAAMTSLPAPPHEAARPLPPRPRLAARTPMPRPAPPASKAATASPTPPPGAAAMADPKATPGKSVPAPVAGKPAGTIAGAGQNKADQAPVNANMAATTAPTTPTKPGDGRPSAAPQMKPAEARSGRAAGIAGHKKAPRNSGRFEAERDARYAAFCFHDLRLAVADRDLARLLGLGDFAYEVDVQEAVLERGALHFDMLGELERALEGAGRDALIEHVTFVLFGLGLLLALDRQHVFLRYDRNFGFGKAGDRNRDAIGILAGAFDVVGRIARRARFVAGDIVEHGKQPVETDGRTIKRS